MLVSEERDEKADTTFFPSAIAAHGLPAEVTSDRAHTPVHVVTDLVPDALHDTTQYANMSHRANAGGCGLSRDSWKRLTGLMAP